MTTIHDATEAAPMVQVAYVLSTGQVIGFALGNKRAASAAFRKRFPERHFGGRFGVQVMPITDWTEDDLDDAHAFSMPRTADVQRAINTHFGWKAADPC
jgi:hypothetical protein